jgi:hypothetical protein
MFVVIDIGGLKITLGFLRSVVVRAGQVVKRSELVAYANGPVHLGVRQGSAYLDPRPLFSSTVVRLTQ